MRNSGQFLKVYLLITIYCLGVYVSTKSYEYSSALIVEQNEGKKNVISKKTNDNYQHTQQTESLLTSFSESFFSSYKLPLKDFWTLAYSSELLFKAKHKQYPTSLVLFLISSRKAELIYPFHDFW